YAAASTLPVPGHLFVLAFAGSIATALADTLSSEVGTLYGPPHLVTTFETVPPGTDGAVTWQGELAGLAGALVVAVLAGALLPATTVGAALVFVGGVVGMTVDSLAGATIEGAYVGNQSVNSIATIAGGIASALLAAAIGVVAF
ncbi:DUF92 domain-containing protein, partial [Halarchaeum acidiphilum]